MAKNTQPEVSQEQKVQTKYDKKIEARKKQKEQELKHDKLSKIIGTVVAIVLLVAIAASIAIPVINKNKATKETYVKIGNHEITKLEYDYYYNLSVNNYVTTYGQLLPYLGLDTTADFADQPYTENMTWKDYFDQMAVEQIIQMKAMVDDAKAAGFTYDSAPEYESFVKSIKDTSDAAGTAVNDYYKTTFGTYATEKNVAPFIQENMFAGAYNDELMTKNAPTDEEVQTYYQENKKIYDRVDFRSFPVVSDAITTESTEEEITAIMGELKTQAEAMKKAREDGADFETLCIENASEEAKASYEDETTEYSLSEGTQYSGTATIMGDWLFADERKENEIAVLEDATNHRYYVVEFIKRYFDEADNETIANTMASTKVTEYITSLAAAYEVTDVQGDLKYLTIPETPVTDTATEDTTTEDTTTEDTVKEEKVTE